MSRVGKYPVEAVEYMGRIAAEAEHGMRRRGFTDLVINGSFWLGAALGALGAVVVLDPAIIDPEIGWRLAFVTGGVIGIACCSCAGSSRRAHAGS